MAWTYDGSDWARVQNGVIQLKNADGTWSDYWARPEHAESLGYVTTAANSPEVDKLVAYARAGGSLNAEQQAFMANPLVGMDSFGQSGRWGGSQNLFDNTFDPQQAGALMQFGVPAQLSAADVAAGNQFNFDQSPAQQDDGDGGFGLMELAMLAAAVYSGGAAGGLWGGLGEGAALAAGDAMAGLIPAGELGAWTGAAGAAAGSVAPAGWTQSAWDGLMSGNYSAVTGANAGSGAMEWTDFLGDASIGDITGSGGSSLADLQTAANQFGWSDLASPGTTAGANADIAGSSWLNNLAQSAINDPLGAAAKAIKSLGMTPAQVLGGGLNAVGGLLAGNAQQEAAQTAANAQLEAARIAADAAKFKPIGITTRFGQSQFQKDAQGNVIGAGYALTPEMKAQQDALMAQSGQMLTQYQNAPGMFAPMGTAGQRAMSLGNQYLATDPQAQAQKYMQEQQALLATGRERDMNQMLTGEFNRGTYGLATGGTSTGMGAANPRLEAMLNAQRQQDLGLAAQATQGGMDYAKFGAGMVGMGGDLTRGMFSGQTAAYDPYKTALGGAQYIEGLGQQPLTMGIDIGKQTSNAASGGLLAQGMANAAQTMQPANAYSPWGTAMMNAGSSVASYQNQQQQQQQQAQQQAFQNAIIAKQFGMVSGGI